MKKRTSSGKSGIGLALLTDVCLMEVLPLMLGTELRVSSMGLMSLPVSVEAIFPARLEAAVVEMADKGGRSSSPSAPLTESGEEASSWIALPFAALRAFAAACKEAGSG
jgi:hypothetical protein